MKLLTSTTLLLISGFVVAEDYQSITKSSYSQVDIYNTRIESYGLRSTYYFDKKSTLGPLDQFEFINKTTNVFGSYNYQNVNNDNLKHLGLGGEVFFDNVLIGGTYRQTDHDNYGDFKAGTLKLGYLFSDNFIVRATAFHAEGADTSYYFDASYNHQINQSDYLGVTISTAEDLGDKTISSKYFTKLGDDKYLVARLSYTDSVFSNSWNVGTSYYFNKQTSVSADYGKNDRYSLGVNYFINDNFAVDLKYGSSADNSDYDVYTLGLTLQL